MKDPIREALVNAGVKVQTPREEDFNKYRRGIFTLSKDLIEQGLFPEITKGMTIYRAEMRWDLDAIEYYAVSQYFDEIEGGTVPNYVAEMTKEGEEITIRWRKA